MTDHFWPVPDANWPEPLTPVREQLGTPLNVHRVLARHPDLLSAWWPFRNHVATGSVLRPLVREVVILRTAHHHGCRYEWTHHLPRALRAGLADADVEQLTAENPALGEPLLHSVVLGVDEVCRFGRLSPALRTELHGHLGVPGVLDVLFTIGAYTTLAFAIESLDVPLDADH